MNGLGVMRRSGRGIPGDLIFQESLDRTELSGRFDYKQRQPGLDPTDRDDDLASSFLRFIHELQLKLERAKGPVETFVIDRAAKPSPNQPEPGPQRLSPDDKLWFGL